MKITILLYIHILIIICGSYVIYKLKIKLTYNKDFKRTVWNQLNDKCINCPNKSKGIKNLWQRQVAMFTTHRALANWGTTAQKLAVWFPGRMVLDL